MGKKVTSHDELPDWFKEADYLAADNFSDFDWYFHLHSRDYIRWVWELVWGHDSCAEYPDDYDPQEAWNNDTSGLVWGAKEQLRLIREFPASPIGPTIPLSKLGPAFEYYEIYAARRWTRPISRLTLFNLCNALWHLPGELKNKVIAEAQSSPGDLVDKISKSAFYASWGELAAIDQFGGTNRYEAIDNELNKLVRVDFSIPDDQLIEEFKRFLKTCRSEAEKEYMGLDQNIKIQTQKWIDYGVLPYWDLQLWAAENDRIITSSYAVKALDDHSAIRDPEYKFSAYTIDTTVKKYTYQALSDQSLTSFKAMASSEIESREKSFRAELSKILQKKISRKN